MVPEIIIFHILESKKMGDSNEASQKLEESAAVELTGKIMVVAIIVLFVVIAVVVFLHLYAKWYWRHTAQRGNTITRRRRRLNFAGSHHQVLTAATALRGRGLDPSFLKTMPIILFSPQDFKDGLECSVCLSEVTQGEKTRILPKCNHGFHVQCIDMWFQSHSTCPICRNPIHNSNSDQLSTQGITHNTPEAAEYSSNAAAAAATVLPTETLSFPTNVLYWGNEVQVSTLPLQDDHDDVVTSSQQVSSTSSSSSISTTTSSDTMGGDGHYLVIEIPRQTNQEEDQKSPVLSRLRSLRRLLSRDRKINPFTPSSSVDVEQAATSQN